LREVIRNMYVSPEAWKKAVKERMDQLNLDEWQAIEDEVAPRPGYRETSAEGEGVGSRQRPEPPEFSTLPSAVGSRKLATFSAGERTPEFGRTTPAFEIDGDLEPEDWQNEEEELGPGRRTSLIGSLMDGRCWTFPRWPTWEQDSDDEDTIFATTNEVKGYIAGRAVPVNPMDLPWKMQHINDARGAIVSLTWKKPVPFDNGRTQRTIWFTENTYGS